MLLMVRQFSRLVHLPVFFSDRWTGAASWLKAFHVLLTPVNLYQFGFLDSLLFFTLFLLLFHKIHTARLMACIVRAACCSFIRAGFAIR